jgi:hypothetical protein
MTLFTKNLDNVLIFDNQNKMMSHSILPSQQKLAEKLTILNDRGIGMLTRISNIKKVSSSNNLILVPRTLSSRQNNNNF